MCKNKKCTNTADSAGIDGNCVEDTTENGTCTLPTVNSATIAESNTFGNKSVKMETVESSYNHEVFTRLDVCLALLRESKRNKGMSSKLLNLPTFMSLDFLSCFKEFKDNKYMTLGEFLRTIDDGVDTEDILYSPQTIRAMSEVEGWGYAFNNSIGVYVQVEEEFVVTLDTSLFYTSKGSLRMNKKLTELVELVLEGYDYYDK